jgi:hypothetical protein
MFKDLKKKLLSLEGNFTEKIFLVFISLCILIAGLIYLWAGERAKSYLIEQDLLKQKILAKSGAKSIENFLDYLENSFTFLSQDSRLLDSPGDIQTVLDEYYSKWTDSPVAGLLLSDDKGIVIATAGRLDKSQIGNSILDKKFFDLTKNNLSGKVIIGAPIKSWTGDNSNELVVNLAKPVLKNGNFKGVLTIIVSLSDLAKEYLEFLKTSTDTNIYLINSDGVLLYAPTDNLIGVNIYDYLNNNPFPGSNEIVNSIKETINRQDSEGNYLYKRPGLINKNLLSQEILVFSRVKARNALDTEITAGKQPWFLAIETSDKNSLFYLKSFESRQTAVFIIGLILLLVFSILGIFSYRLKQRNSYLKGFEAGSHYKKINSGKEMGDKLI